MKKRVECDNCRHFVEPEFQDGNWFMMIKRPSCNLGKRIMFIQPTPSNGWAGGFFRYCNEFINKY